MVFHKVSYCLLPYTISSQPIRSIRSFQWEWNCHICGRYCDLCVYRRSRGGLRYTATTPRFSFHILQAVEYKNQRGQDPGNIFHPMLVVSKETANCSYQGWGHPIPSYPILGVTFDKRHSHSPVTRPGLSRNRRKPIVYYIHFSIGSRSLMCVINYYFTNDSKATFVLFKFKKKLEWNFNERNQLNHMGDNHHVCVP
jgi:hypothetical protein